MNMALTADVRSGAVSVRTLCEPDARLIHPDQTTPAHAEACPLGCASATQCRSEHPIALLLLAPEDD
jgi:hypothetical protein